MRLYARQYGMQCAYEYMCQSCPREEATIVYESSEGNFMKFSDCHTAIFGDPGRFVHWAARGCISLFHVSCYPRAIPPLSEVCTETGRKAKWRQFTTWHVLLKIQRGISDKILLYLKNGVPCDMHAMLILWKCVHSGKFVLQIKRSLYLRGV